MADKEKELATLRAQVNRRDRKKNDGKDEERQKRLNRLTMDLENDRIMIQKLEELNQQLEVIGGDFLKRGWGVFGACMGALF